MKDDEDDENNGDNGDDDDEEEEASSSRGGKSNAANRQRKSLSEMTQVGFNKTDLFVTLAHHFVLTMSG